MSERIPRIGPRAYARIATAAFVLLALIVFSGAAVRLTGSGLGCPTWPECHGHLVTTKLDYHGAIEYGNRLITGVVAIAAMAAALLAFLRRPFRRDLAWLGVALPLGVVAQATLGGLVVLYGLAPGFVMGHFLLSLTVLVAAFALMWRARRPLEESTPTEDRRTVLATRALLPLAAWVLVLGTIATGSGPAPGHQRRPGGHALLLPRRRHDGLGHPLARPLLDAARASARWRSGSTCAGWAPPPGCVARSRRCACCSPPRASSASSSTRTGCRRAWCGSTWCWPR